MIQHFTHKMAKKEKKVKGILERTYNIPLRKEWLKAPRYKRAKKAVKAIREFLMKHMKSEEVKVGKHLNLKIWEHGIKNPPHHVKVNAIKYDNGVVKAELFGFKIEEEEKEEKKKEAKKTEESVKKELGLEEKADGGKEAEAKEEKDKEDKEKAPEEKKKEKEPKEEAQKEEFKKEINKGKSAEEAAKPDAKEEAEESKK